MSNVEISDFVVMPNKGITYIPQVEFTKEGVFKLIGSSFMENPTDFYEAITDWLEDFLIEKHNIEFHIVPDYYNTSSAKCLDEILKVLRDYRNPEEGRNIQVYWYYEEDDPDNLDDGEDFQALIDIPFEIVSFTGTEYPVKIDREI